MDTANDRLCQIKHDGDSKADFYLPAATEMVDKVLADHLTKSNMEPVHIKATLAATKLRETIDNNHYVCDSLAMAADARLQHLLRKAKSAVTVCACSTQKLLREI